MKNIILFFIPFLLGTALCAQNVTTQNIRWKTGKIQDVNAGNVSEEQDQIISYGTNRIEWQNAKGVVKKTFTISGTNGSWTNVQNNGSILYQVTAGEQSGTATIIRTAGEFLIRIILIKGEEDPDIYEMSITSFETL